MVRNIRLVWCQDLVKWTYLGVSPVSRLGTSELEEELCPVGNRDTVFFRWRNSLKGRMLSCIHFLLDAPASSAPEEGPPHGDSGEWRHRGRETGLGP